MAKNKNRKQGSRHDRVSTAERGNEDAKSTSFEARAQDRPQTQDTSSDTSRKHQRRFGHN
ncbi:hypothetical protein OG923_26295 [Streptomyces halstedii]|uniref:hypothetical protein n=1 Tax=Streptomyces halstedii TaxID=1944 RepID=UPI0032450143